MKMHLGRDKKNGKYSICAIDIPTTNHVFIHWTGQISHILLLDVPQIRIAHNGYVYIQHNIRSEQ